MLRTALLTILAIPAVLAHEGHHAADSVLGHMLTQPDHLALLGLALAGVAGLVVALRRRAQAVREH
ncbi:MAG: hypothetical protein PF961_19365 [Planctomycetota bacterium]|nr:hypothetical protein [Planctomycetota bacterium]